MGHRQKRLGNMGKKVLLYTVTTKHATTSRFLTFGKNTCL